LSSGSSHNGLELLLKHRLRRKRLFVVKVSRRFFTTLGVLKVNVLFMPRIKTKPKADSRGSFYRFVLFRGFNWDNPFFINASKNYVDERRLKMHKFRSPKDKKINK